MANDIRKHYATLNWMAFQCFDVHEKKSRKRNSKSEQERRNKIRLRSEELFISGSKRKNVNTRQWINAWKYRTKRKEPEKNMNINSIFQFCCRVHGKEINKSYTLGKPLPMITSRILFSALFLALIEVISWYLNHSAWKNSNERDFDAA